MDGWVEFPTASASIAASQTKSVRFMPPVISVIGKDGKWTIADNDPGFPAGKGKSVLVDLTGKFATTDGRVLITSTQRLHWDAFWISTGKEGERTLTALPLCVRPSTAGAASANGVESPGQPWTYSHSDLETFYRWDQMPMGTLTRYGDVKALLEEIDDKYPVLASGDVVSPGLRRVRTTPAQGGLGSRLLLHTTEGWVKDADMNQAVRERVGPLPFARHARLPVRRIQKRPPLIRSGSSSGLSARRAAWSIPRRFPNSRNPIVRPGFRGART